MLEQVVVLAAHRFNDLYYALNIDLVVEKGFVALVLAVLLDEAADQLEEDIRKGVFR
jgi:hypothetical protein